MAHVGLLEDNTRIAKLCATMLHYAGHQVTIYEHPRECLAALLPVAPPVGLSKGAAIPPTFEVEVLILDLHLPDMPGLDVLRTLRTHPDTKALPLIFCTAAAPSEVTCALSIAPQAIFLEKPFTYQELVSAVATALGKQVY
jgi:CheY-like chemotaxis protein